MSAILLTTLRTVESATESIAATAFFSTCHPQLRSVLRWQTQRGRAITSTMVSVAFLTTFAPNAAAFLAASFALFALALAAPETAAGQDAQGGERDSTKKERES
eukprot:COSAG06_NODE_17578_length_933_cov_0.747002_2_plen_104_part_00